MTEQGFIARAGDNPLTGFVGAARDVWQATVASGQNNAGLVDVDRLTQLLRQAEHDVRVQAERIRWLQQELEHTKSQLTTALLAQNQAVAQGRRLAADACNLADSLAVMASRYAELVAPMRHVNEMPPPPPTPIDPKD